MGRHGVALLLMLVLAGCTSSSPGTKVGTRPSDWNTGDELIGYTSGYAHAGNYDASAAPPENLSVPRPVSCFVSREDVRYSKDSCLVIVAQQSRIRGEPRLGPWALHMLWKGGLSGSAYGDPGMSGWATDADGNVVAFWAGKFTANASRYTQ